ncbi:hypothetical protein GC173_15145 [bacterium]|nr:hypothetical protein [bacterium]
MEEGQQAGAAAELEVIDRLSQLSDDWFVLSDVRLEAGRWYRYEGTHLRTAQLDHVLVGPGGVFVIETKNWSRGFVESGDYFNPFIQVGRASYLCHVTLEAAGLPSRTRSIIATRGHLPENKVDARAKVLPPEGMVGYVNWFGSQLAPNDAARVVRHLEHFLPKN